jgi:hypothetical protein
VPRDILDLGHVAHPSNLTVEQTLSNRFDDED